ncbi:MAG: hypothetical protein JOY71_01070 [Acetobacteraceae bacterium]|nr:hypothetical protein [Acetobacteraceae bacterium]
MPAAGALHENFDPTARIKGGSDRSFGSVFAGIFAVIALHPLLAHAPVRWWALAIAGILLAVALIRPAYLRALNRLWLQFSLRLQQVVNPIILGLLFFAAVTPTAMVLRMMKSDPLRLRMDRDASTYWIDRKAAGMARNDMRRQF